MGVTSDDLISQIKRRSFVPISQSTYESSDLLSMCTEELRIYVAPKIMSVREDYFVDYFDQAITASKEFYQVPRRAMGNSLKALFMLDSQNKFLGRLERTELSRIDGYTENGKPSKFYLQGDSVGLKPTPSSTENTLRMYYFLRQSELVLTSSVAKITAVNDTGLSVEFTVDTDLSGSLNTGSFIDFQNAQSPYLLWAYDVAITAITSSVITVAKADVVDGASQVLPGVGDYICPQLQSNIPQIPEEFHPVLAQRVTCKIYEALGDTRKYQIAFNDLKMIEETALNLIRNRVEDSPEKIKSRNTILGSVASRPVGV